MGKQLVLGSILGASALFVWSAIAWMLIPWPGEPLRSFTNEDAITQAIAANVPRSGNYLLPYIQRRTVGWLLAALVISTFVRGRTATG